MNFVDVAPYVQICLIIIIPAASGFYHLFFTSLRSPIHFQQGLKELSCWRSALALTLLSAAPFVCLLPFGASSSLIFYFFGYVSAVLFAALLVAPVLHYIPSPSICQYFQRRFHFSFLRLCIVVLNSLISAILATVLLMFSTSLAACISSYSPLIVCPLLGYISIFSIIFGGQSTVSSPTFFSSCFIIILGIALLLYNGVEELSGFRENAFVGTNLVSLPSVTFYFLGLLNGLHLLTSSPIMYQQYFALYNRQRLRSTFLLHCLFFIIFAVSLNCVSLLYKDFMSNICPNPSTFSSLLQFFYAIIPQSSMLSLFVISSFIFITFVSFTFIILSLSTTIWEDLLRVHVNRWSQVRQLCTLQVILFVTGSFLIGLSIVVLYYIDDLLGFSPHIFLVLSAVAAPITAILLCAVLFPCITGKGATAGLLIGYLMLLAASVIRFSRTSLQSLNPCSNATVLLNGTQDQLVQSILLSDSLAGADIPGSLHSNLTADLQVESSISLAEQSKLDESFHYLYGLPLTLLPAVIFAITTICAIGASLCSKGEKVVTVDLNLMVDSLFTRALLPHAIPTTGSRKAFIESESFRYAQQTAYPDANYSDPKASMVQRCRTVM